MSWKIRKVNENTQSSFRLFSEGSLGGKSCNLSRAALLQTGGTPVDLLGDASSKGCGVESGGRYTATTSSSQFFLLYQIEPDRLGSRRGTQTTQGTSFNHWVSLFSHLQTRATEILTLKCCGNVESKMCGVWPSLLVSLPPFL